MFVYETLIIPVQPNMATSDKHEDQFDDFPDVAEEMNDLFDDESVYEAPHIVMHQEVTLMPSQKELRGKPDSNIKVRICIRLSSIPGAGLGVFAEDDIPAGYCHEYEGVYIPYEKARCVEIIKWKWIMSDVFFFLLQDKRSNVSAYRWTIFEVTYTNIPHLILLLDILIHIIQWDKETGEKISEKVAGYVDGKKLETSNWTRYVNTASSEEGANIIQWQEFNRPFYGTKRLIRKGEEILAWYGLAFARALGLVPSSTTNEANGE